MTLHSTSPYNLLPHTFFLFFLFPFYFLLAMKTYPSYLKLFRRGEISRRVESATRKLEACVLCPRACKANRAAGETGECGVGRLALVASACPHFGEESVLVGLRGSGTVFFAGCNLHCVFCQNYDISQMRMGREVAAAELADIFLDLQDRGCHNLNLVTPSHVVAQVLEALVIAVERGFRLPIVYNSSGYDALGTLRLLDGIVDIYMPDVKYSDSRIAEQYSGVKHYWDIVRQALREMHTQVGDLQTINGIAVRGLLVRHLVLPNRIAGTDEVMRFLAENISVDSYVNVMDQYRPMYRAGDYPELSRRPTRDELNEAVHMASRYGVHRGDAFDTE